MLVAEEYLRSLRAGTIADVLEMSDFFAEEHGMNRPFSRALAEVIIALEDHGIRFALVGAVAAGKRGMARATMDIDIAVRSRRGVAKALAEITDAVHPFTPMQGGADAAKFVHSETGTEIDVLAFATGPGRSAVEHAVVVRIGRSLHAPVAPAEELICLKLVAALSSLRVAEKRKLDEADIMSVMRRQGVALDTARLARLLAELPPRLRAPARRKLAALVRELR